MNPRVDWLLKRPLYQRMLMLAGVVVIIVGLSVWLLFVPQQEALARLTKQSADLQVKLDKDRRVAANLPIFKAEYEKMQQKLELALTELPNGKEIPTLLSTISSTAKMNGLDVLTFKPGEEIAKGFYAEVPVTLRLEGSFHQLANFFYKVGTLPRIVNIGNVKIGVKKVGNDGGSPRLSVDCLATTFRFIEESTAQSASAVPAKAGRKGK